ncbi:MAG: pyridoxamine 5'-phosphate oxidase family protein [Solirubrobacterales bacterium]
MRRKDREITDMAEMLKVLDKCKVCRVGMKDKDGLYIVPLNFGYSFENNELVLYFHSAKEGRKISAIMENNSVCFEMDCEHSLITADTACGYGYSFKSIIGNGKAEFIEEAEEKKRALSILMKHQTGMDFTFDDKMAGSVAVFKITSNSFTGKDHK